MSWKEYLPGENCALCCTIFSTWGCLFLIVVGLLVKNGYPGIDPAMTICPSDRPHAAIHAWISAALYGIIAVGCLIAFVRCQLNKSKARTAYIPQE